MSIKVCEKTVDVIRAGGISIPFLGIVMKEDFVHQRVRVLWKGDEMYKGDGGTE